MGPPKASIRRTRLGCWSCKKRRRRCDEKKPSCGGCLKRGLPCHYGVRLLWEHEANSMGIAFGRGTKSPSGKTHYLLPSRPHAARHWLNTTSDDVRCIYDGPAHGWGHRRGTEIDDSVAASIVTPSSLSQCPFRAETDRYLFDYFAHTCTMRRSLVDQENPWRSVVLPLCCQSEGLLHMAIAWAAHILRNQCASQDVSRYDQIILTRKCQSLKFLHNMVTQDSRVKAVFLGRTKCERDALLLLVMFHCLLEIASGSIKEWTYHMNGALMIIKFYTNSGGTARRDVFSQEVLELVYSFFLEKGTFLGTTTHTRSSNEHRYLSSLEWSTEVRAIFPFLTSYGSTKIDPCMGLSPELLDIISCITMLSQRGHTNSTTMTQEFIGLVHRLRNLETRTAHWQTDKEYPHIMTLLASAFHSATWIYFYHVLANCSLESDIIQKTYLPTLLSTLAQIHKTQGPLLGFLPYPMWALFVASCVVLEEGRIQILEWFSVLNANKPVSNVPSTMAAVRAIWKRRDLGLECARDEGSEGSAIWMDAIGNLGWLMPFT